MSEQDLAQLYELWLLKEKMDIARGTKTHDGLRGTNVLIQSRAMSHPFGVILDGFLFGMMI